ncbi:hypothetical protein [Deinococcus yunweiensis]|uniref:hypothetical protein n=1 Tax=Deinococcus yunweiensis TaxID=367282 RepID=UPI00398ED061
MSRAEHDARNAAQVALFLADLPQVTARPLITRHDLNLTTFYRPAFAVANLYRAGEGELVVRHAGRLVERRRYSLPRCRCGEPMDCFETRCEDCGCRQ